MTGIFHLRILQNNPHKISLFSSASGEKSVVLTPIYSSKKDFSKTCYDKIQGSRWELGISIYSLKT